MESTYNTAVLIKDKSINLKSQEAKSIDIDNLFKSLLESSTENESIQGSNNAESSVGNAGIVLNKAMIQILSNQQSQEDSEGNTDESIDNEETNTIQNISAGNILGKSNKAEMDKLKNEFYKYIQPYLDAHHPLEQIKGYLDEIVNEAIEKGPKKGSLKGEIIEYYPQKGEFISALAVYSDDRKRPKGFFDEAKKYFESMMELAGKPKGR